MCKSTPLALKIASASDSTSFQFSSGCDGWLALFISSRMALNSGSPRGSLPVTIVCVSTLLFIPASSVQCV
ncbi:Uncharacterised protein [Shigella sonnei]|nr:Uncharacterised protein [Shigella sonnei]